MEKPTFMSLVQKASKEREELETRLKLTLASPQFKDVNGEYERLLSILGNVDGDEIVALVLIARMNVWQEVVS